jgi:tetratricopeptide (TPR) repeat protein
MEPSHLHIYKERNLRPLSFFILCLFLAVILFSFCSDKQPSPEKKRLYYVPPADYLVFVSATHKILLSQLFFIRGIMDLSEKFPQGSDRVDYLLQSFKAATALDPKLISAYFFGGFVSPKTGEEIEKGSCFLEEGMKKNPQDWRLPFWLGFNNLELGRYAAAIDYYRKAVALPQSPDYLKTNLAFLYYQSGNFSAGVLYLRGLLLSVQDERLKRLLAGKIRWLEGLALLEDKLQQYHRRFGSWPRSLDDLKERGLLQVIPQDDFGEGYYLKEDLSAGRPKVKSR